MEHYLERNHCRLFIKEEGEGPVLLLIHGVACDCNFFDGAAERLKDCFKVVTFDRRGYSRSTIEKGYLEKEDDSSMAEQAEDALAVLKMVSGGNNEPVTAVGCSAGGLVAIELARKYPEMVSKLFLYETAYAVTKEELDGIREWKLNLKEAADKRRIARAMLLLMEEMGPADEEARPVSPEMLQRNMDNLGRFLYAELEAILGYSERNQGIRLEMPIYCGCGENDRETKFYHMTQEAAKSWGVECTCMKGSHNLAQDRPDTFAGWILEKTGVNL